MKPALRVAAGVLLGCGLLLLFWIAGIVEPPEGLSRALAVLAATYPGPGGRATSERIACPPLPRLRLYVVCTDDCEGVWRIVGVRGLAATNLANLNKLPPDSPETLRRAANGAIAAEGLHLDVRGARGLIGCYLRLAGLHPERVLRDGDRDRLEEARANLATLTAFAESLGDEGGVERIPILETPAGFTSRFDYWDTASAGAPIVTMTWRLRRDGTIDLYRASPPPLTDDSESGNTPGKPPT